MPHQDKRLYPLASYSIGIWRTPEKTKAYLLVLDRGSSNKRLRTEHKQFIVLVTREADTRASQHEPGLSVNWMLGWLRHQVSLRLRHKNPFVDHAQHPDRDGSVLTFEINWSSIVGMDFKWPLTDDPRLVLEAAVMSKRVFDTVEDVCLHYQAQPTSSKSPRMSLIRLLAATEQQAQRYPAPPEEATVAEIGNTQLSDHYAAGAACAPRQQQQQQQQQQGVSMSRVSSWASWSSHTSAARSSLEHPPIAVAVASDQTPAAPAEAPAGSGSEITPTAANVGPCKVAVQQEQCQQQCNLLLEGCSMQLHHQQPADSVVLPAEVTKLDQWWLADANGAAQPQQQHHSRACSCSSGSGMPLSLTTAPTLSAGVAAMGSATTAEAETAAAASAALWSASSVSFEGFGECPTPPVSTFRQQDQQSKLSSLSICNGYDSLPSATDRPESASSGVSSPARRKLGIAGPPAEDRYNGVVLMPALTHPFRKLHLPPAIPIGYATAPCSAPSSPKIGLGLGGRTGSGQFTAALGAEASQQQLLQEIQQPLQDLHAQQLQQQRHHQKSRYAADRSSTRSKSKFQACPLCNQPLLQPLDVLQQRFHQQQEFRHRKTGSRGVAKSRSACSLEQLVQQAKAISSSSGVQQVQSQQPNLEQPANWKHQGGAGGTSIAGGVGSSTKPNEVAGSCSSCAGSTVFACTPVQSTAVATPAAAAEVGNSSCSKGSCLKLEAGLEVGTEISQEFVTGGQGHARSHNSASAAAGIVPSPTSAAAAAVYGGKFASLATAVGAAQGATTLQPPYVAGDMSRAESGDHQQQQQHAEQQESKYRTRTVIMTFKDPTLPHKLREFVSSDVRLLKLYESGLPGWAIILPSYGLYYRPMLRRVTWLLFILLSIVSMAMGFYDLYKNVPYFKQIMVSMFRPAAAVFEWLEGHTQIRLSILLTYMLGRTQIIVQLIKFFTHTSLQPILEPIATALAPLTSALSATIATAAWALQPVVSAVKALASPISMLARLVWLLLQLLWQLLSLLLWSGPLQLLQAVAAAVTGLLQLLLMPFQLLIPAGATIRAGWTAAKGAGQVARSAVPVVKSSAAAASSSWPTLAWFPLEAIELLRVSTLRIVRALQAVVKFFVTLGSAVNQHRLSLMLQLRQHLRGSLRAAADSSAGRVATAVAVKMGQEERVQRLHRRLRQTDSIVSFGSEALGHADSAAFGMAMTLDRELSVTMSLNGATEEYSMRDREPSVTAAARRDADSDEEEVTSALAEVVGVSPAEVHRSSEGLRHRPAAGPANATRFAQFAAAAGNSKQVSFADVEAGYADVATLSHQLPAHALRRSVDVVTAGNFPGIWAAGIADGRYSSMSTGQKPGNTPTAGAKAVVGSLDSAGGYLRNPGVILQLPQSAAEGNYAPVGLGFEDGVPVAGMAVSLHSPGVQSWQGMSPGTAALAAMQPGPIAERLRRNSWG